VCWTDITNTSAYRGTGRVWGCFGRGSPATGAGCYDGAHKRRRSLPSGWVDFSHAGCLVPGWCTLPGSALRRYPSKVRAVCGNSARTDPCGGCEATRIPTATSVLVACQLIYYRLAAPWFPLTRFGAVRTCKPSLRISGSVRIWRPSFPWNAACTAPSRCAGMVCSQRPRGEARARSSWCTAWRVRGSGIHP